MSIEKDDKQGQPVFPEGYEHFADMAHLAASRLRELDKRIKNIPEGSIKEKSFELRFHPTSLNSELNKWRNRDNRQVLEAKKAEIEQDLYFKMGRDIETWEIDIETATQIQQATSETLHPNPFEGMSREQLLQIKSAAKDENHSQNYMRSLINESRKTPTQSPKESQLKQTETKQQAKSDLSYAQQYTLKISFGSLQEGKTPKKDSKSIEPDKD